MRSGPNCSISIMEDVDNKILSKIESSIEWLMPHPLNYFVLKLLLPFSSSFISFIKVNDNPHELLRQMQAWQGNCEMEKLKPHQKKSCNGCFNLQQQALSSYICVCVLIYKILTQEICTYLSITWNWGGIL